MCWEYHILCNGFTRSHRHRHWSQQWNLNLASTNLDIISLLLLSEVSLDCDAIFKSLCFPFYLYVL